MSKVYSIEEINNYISNKINNDYQLQNISIEGEISNLKHHHLTGNCYLTLKNKDSILKAMVFKNQFSKIKDILKEGDKIIANGSIRGYARNASYSFIINGLEKKGLGNIYQKFEKLKQFYSSKGYFDISIKKPLPRFPKNIGIITADTGAAVKDIVTTIKRRYKIANLFLFPCIVQGKAAPLSILEQIKNANNFKIPLEILIVGRGGGSFEDLICFSDPKVIEGIYQSTIPIISAVGHEIDFQLSDFVADKRAATPTAAAELATPDLKEIILYLNNNLNIIQNILQHKINNMIKLINFYKENYYLKNLNWIYSEKQEKIKNLFYSLNSNFNYLLQNKSNDLKEVGTKLKLLNPTNVLKRGFSIIKNKQNDAIITSIKNIHINTDIKILLQDGTAAAKIT